METTKPSYPVLIELTSELWSTVTNASMIGTIIAAVAPLEIHIETKAVVTMKPNRIIFGDVPRNKIILNAMRLCRPECSTHTPSIKPPNIIKLVALM